MFSIDPEFLPSQWAVVDTTIIAPTSSIKNAFGTRDTEMHQAKKVNQCFLGMTAHIGKDSYVASHLSGRFHSKINWLLGG